MCDGANCTPEPEPCCNSPEPENHYHGWYVKATDLRAELPSVVTPTFAKRVVDAALLIYWRAPSGSTYSWSDAIEQAIDVVMAEDFSKENK